MYLSILYLCLLFNLMYGQAVQDGMTPDSIWNKINLADARAKITRSAKGVFIPLWLPVGAGAAGVSTYFIVSGKKKKEDIEIPVAKDDVYNLMCGMSHEINPLENDIGTNLSLVAVDNDPNGWVTLSNQKLTVSAQARGQFSITYTITNKDNQSASANITITISVPEFTVRNLSYEVLSGTSVIGNIMQNSVCEQCVVKQMTGPANPSLIWDALGNFSVIPVHTGIQPHTFLYRFEIEGKCQITVTAELTITVIPQKCDVTPTFSMIPAGCDMSDGTVTVNLESLEDYTLMWNTGQTSSTLTAIPAGNYSLILSNEKMHCVSEFSVVLPENPAKYLENVMTGPGNCFRSGEWQITLPEGRKFFVSIMGESQQYLLELAGGNHDLITLLKEQNVTGPITGRFILTVREQTKDMRCTESLTVEIPDVTVPFSSKNDTLSGQQDMLITANILQNDTGTGLYLVSITQVPGVLLEYKSNGDIVFRGAEGNYHFTYTVRDTCGREQKADILIIVSHVVCAYTATFTVMPASCGTNTGSASIVLSPVDGALIVWSNGLSGNTISNITAGIYFVTVTHPTGACFQVFSVQIPMINPPYVIQSIVVQPDCVNKQEIILELQAPVSGFLTIVAVGPISTFTITVPAGTIKLSNHVLLIPGTWTLLINDASVATSCAQEYSFVLMNYIPPVITLLDVEPPSSPSANNGIAFVQISGGSPPYIITGGPQTYSNLMSGLNILTGFPIGVFTLFAIDAAGCKTLPIVVIMGGEPPHRPELAFLPQSVLLSKVTADPEHPDKGDMKYEANVFQSIYSSHSFKNSYIGVLFGRSLPRQTFGSGAIQGQDLYVLMTDAGARSSYQNLTLHFGPQLMLLRSRNQDNSSLGSKINLEYNITIRSHLKIHPMLLFMHSLSWYPEHNKWAGNQSLVYLF
ncbi:MAG: hypothetical protein IPM26_01305 [Saprospiraceae bacterium]|nr:hypothetical protein [Saprospiraceae bacterium]